MYLCFVQVHNTCLVNEKSISDSVRHIHFLSICRLHVVPPCLHDGFIMTRFARNFLQLYSIAVFILYMYYIKKIV